MHFALPPRKTSHPPPYARAAARSSQNQRRKRIQLVGYIVLGALTIWLVLRWVLSSKAASADHGAVEEDPKIVIVTVFDEMAMSREQIRMVKANRDDYAARHGYQNFYTNTTAYAHLLDNMTPTSWCLIPALRHSLKIHPTTNYVWALTPNALITSPSIALAPHILHNLESLMQKDIPVVPPDSVIHTFSHLKPSHAHLILSQDMDNLAHSSMVLRNSPYQPPKEPSSKPKAAPDNWAFYLLDAWFDPLYRAYQFQKAENHALEHIVQWHPTILAKLVLVPQRILNSYNFAYSTIKDDSNGSTRTHDAMWQEGDLVVNFKGCEESPERNCQKEMEAYFTRWEDEVLRLDGKTKATTKPTQTLPDTEERPRKQEQKTEKVEAAKRPQQAAKENSRDKVAA